MIIRQLDDPSVLRGDNVVATLARRSAMNRVHRRTYRERHLDRVRAWRADYYRRHSVHVDVGEPIPSLHTGHPLFDLACRHVRDGVPMTSIAGESEQARDDARSEFVLAVLEGRDPAEAVRLSMAREVAWQRLTVEIPEAWLA